MAHLMLCREKRAKSITLDTIQPTGGFAVLLSSLFLLHLELSDHLVSSSSEQSTDSSNKVHFTLTKYTLV